MKSRFAIVVALCPLMLTAAAQVRWLETGHDFGAFSEDLGAVDAVFRFVNEDTAAVRVLDSRATCGCTQPKVTQGNIAPGDTGTVTVTYLASGRPGRFSKNIYVRTSDNPRQQRTLTVSGTVIGSTSTLTSRYPVSAGNLKLQTATVAFGDLKRGQQKTIFVNGYNQSADTLRPQIEGLPPYITWRATPAAVPPGEQMQFAFTLQTLDNPEWGISSETFGVRPDVGAEPAEMSFFTIISEDFSTLTPGQRLNAPIARLSSDRVNLGEIPAGSERIKIKFDISNDGKLPLLVRRVQSVDESITDLRLHPDKIKPGKKAALTAFVDPSKADGDFINARITLMVNDPEMPLIVLRVTAEIKR